MSDDWNRAFYDDLKKVLEKYGFDVSLDFSISGPCRTIITGDGKIRHENNSGDLYTIDIMAAGIPTAFEIKPKKKTKRRR